jgi:hypothetical protein
MPVFTLAMLFAQTADGEPTAAIAVADVAAEDGWGWRAGLPDTSPAGRYGFLELRFLHGSAHLDLSGGGVKIGSTIAQRFEYGRRNGDSVGGAVDVGILQAAHVDSAGVRRRFDAATIDADLLMAEMRPIRPMRLNMRVGAGFAWLNYRREGGGVLNAAQVSTYAGKGPLTEAANALLVGVLDDGSLAFRTADNSPSRMPTGESEDPRAKPLFTRSFGGLSLHAGIDDAVALGRSGLALIAAGDVRGIGGWQDYAVSASARSGVRLFRKQGRYRLQVDAGYSVEHWWLHQAGFRPQSGSMAEFQFHGPFAQAELKF